MSGECRTHKDIYKILRREIRKDDSLGTCRPRREDNNKVELGEIGSDDIECIHVVQNVVQ